MMLSHTLRHPAGHIPSLVLILVILDDALALGIVEDPFFNFEKVLILVILDDALAPVERAAHRIR